MAEICNVNGPSNLPRHGLERIVAVVARLRDPNGGCPWDLAQTWATIAPYAIEEAHEVADAIERDDPAAVREELGDLLLQVVLQARIAEDDGHFTLDDVAHAISDKMVARHPHVFGDAATQPDWEALKAAERGASASALDGVALGLPALMRADKLGRRAARHGFDWPDAKGPRAKVDEELAEVVAAPDAAAREEELGDVLFAVAQWARHLGIDPEAALRRANAKFERRFRQVEAQPGFAAADLDQMERWWADAKRA